MGPRSQDLQRLGGSISQGLEVVFGRAGESYGGAHSENERSSDLWGSRGGKYARFQARKELKRLTVSARLMLAEPCARREACPFRDPADRLIAHSEEHVVSACADMIDKQV